MPLEIERKFLVKSEPWKLCTPYSVIRQGYLSTHPSSIVRIRHESKFQHDYAYITVKGKTVGFTKPEYEYQIPPNEAIEMLDNMCQYTLHKRRWLVQEIGHEWHVDQFLDDNRGLVTAEIELTHEGESWDRPEWLGDEVTFDMAYANSNLSMKPWNTW